MYGHCNYFDVDSKIFVYCVYVFTELLRKYKVDYLFFAERGIIIELVLVVYIMHKLFEYIAGIFTIFYTNVCVVFTSCWLSTFASV